MYTTSEVSLKLKCSRQTISNWCAEFAAFLSVTANPQAGAHRRFTGDDMAVLVLVADMKAQGNTYEDIHASLQAGQRGELLASDETAITPSARAELAVYAQKVTALEDEVERLEAETNRLKPFEQQAAIERALRESAEKKLAELEIQVRQLYRDLGRLEGGGSNR